MTMCLRYGAARSCSAQPVCVVGGGNSARQAAMYLATFAKRVFLVIRGESLAASMSAYLIAQIARTPTIEALSHTQVREACGGDTLEAVVIPCDGQQLEKQPARALFTFIGTKPNAEWRSDLAICDPQRLSAHRPRPIGRPTIRYLL